MSDSPLVLPALLISISAAVMLTVFMTTFRHSRSVLLFGIGVTGALDTLQIYHVHVFTVLCLLLPLTSQRSNRKSMRVPMAAFATLGSAAILTISEPYGTLVNSSTLALQVLALAASACILLFELRIQDIRLILLGFVACVTVGGFIAIAQNLTIIAPNYFVDSGGLHRVHSIWREPDFMGFYSAAGLVVALRLRMRRLPQSICILVAGTALTMSFARAAWLALVLSTVVMWIFVRISTARAERNTRIRDLGVVILGLLALTGVIASSGAIRQTIFTRIASALPGANNDVAVRARNGQINALLDLAHQAPWHGFGLSAAGRVLDLGRIDYGYSPNNVATNWVLGWWVDGKYLAVPLIVWIILVAIVTARSLPGHILMLAIINSLFSNVTVSPILWLVLSLALIARRTSGCAIDGRTTRPSMSDSVGETRMTRSGDPSGHFMATQ